MSRGISRRRFLKNGTIAAVGSSALVASQGIPALAGSGTPAFICNIVYQGGFTTPPPLSGTISGSQSYPSGFSVPAGSTLTFDPNVSTTVRVNANVIIDGTLEMKPANASVEHALIFEGIDESAFQGGGIDPLDTDVGLWVMGAGRLDIAGAEKVAWNRIGDDDSWSNSDELIRTPVDPGDYDGFVSFTRGGTVPVVDNPYGGPGSYLVPSPYSFSDTLNNVHALNIEAIADAGITRGCTTVLYCPESNVTRGQMAAFLNRALGLPAAGSAGFTDTAGHTFEDDINRLAAAGITQGCEDNRYCPDDAVTRGQMAAFLNRALNLPAAPSFGFTDTVGHQFRDDIDRIAAAGITQGCTNNLYCPDDLVTRAQMASFLARAFDLPVPELDEITDGTAFRAEVLNLTRNVRIEGTETGKAHIFIRSSSPQSIRFAALRYLAPNFLDTDATGRYGIHFHVCNDGSRGSLVEGVVIRDSDGHAFVPHLSHGVSMVNCISYDTISDAFWWDGGKTNETDDIVWDRCVAAKVNSAGNLNPHRLAGFALQFGSNNTVSNCVAVGVQGLSNAAGFKWPEFANTGVWNFASNTSHNNRRNGFFTWQNDTSDHVVPDFTAYHNGHYGIDHGAYFNSYVYQGAVLFGNALGGIILKAVNHPGDSAALTFSDMVIDGAGITPYLVLNGDHVGANDPYPLPTEFHNCTMVGETTKKVYVRDVTEGGQEPTQQFKDRWDFVDCGVSASDIEFTADSDPNSLVRVQNGSTAFEVDKSGSRSIGVFA